jgi:hypothetical protein
MKRPLSFRAGPDGIGHAQLPRTRVTACGTAGIPERWAWPTLRRCVTCEAIMAARERQAREVPA